MAEGLLAYCKALVCRHGLHTELSAAGGRSELKGWLAKSRAERAFGRSV